ncbi:unnamed protein product [Acanthoscelides obtectus]|uniref:Uncharacterized protein n=1 Tax=Acanthoscelides obtectus TaxID=200917 RepID=A0A9P0P5S3_ACAOB|nr:unnamed protein product [Acanthoscelides obtectus]CAK1655980.1 hypothetical protein AOBTE_LOCUS19486 [Acanthoscelides obtectus]
MGDTTGIVTRHFKSQDHYSLKKEQQQPKGGQVLMPKAEDALEPRTLKIYTFRYQCYLQAIAKQPKHSLLKLAALPPTSAASRQHAFRTYHEVQQ